LRSVAHARLQNSQPLWRYGDTVRDARGMSVSAVKSRLVQVKSFIESRRMGEIESTLKAAEGFLAGLTEDERAPLVAEIAALRAHVATMLTSDDERKISAAKGKLRQARSQLESDPTADVSALLGVAAGYFAGVPDHHTVEIRAEIAALRPQPKAAAAAPVAAPPRTTGVSDDDAAKLSRARSRIVEARNQIGSGRLDAVAPTLELALEFLAGLSEATRAPVLADVEAVRTELAAAMRADQIRIVTTRFERYLRNAASNIESQPAAAATGLDQARELLASDDATGTLSATELEDLRARIADVGTRLAQRNRAEALERAAPAMRELEERVASDPFAGIDSREARLVWSRLAELQHRVVSWLRDLPPDDAEAAAFRTRLVATDAAIDRASAVWGKAQLEAEVEGGWAAIAAAIAGWEDETATGEPLADPELPKTRAAIQRIRYLLDDPQTKQIRAEHGSDPKLEATFREAKFVFQAAADKLAAAYQDVLDAAEQRPAPMRRLELDRPLLLTFAAESALEGTRHRETVVSRARALGARWKAEVAELMQARRQIYDRLTDEAAARWPEIVARLGARDGFDPMDEAWRGKAVVLSGIYNRAGWDFSPRDYPLSFRLDGVPLAGRYEPHVIAALEHAWFELKLDVSDRIAWDVVAIVEGPGQIAERTTVILRDRKTNLEVGKLEEYRPISCVELRVIALHVGPVAVGP
jgi:hypothetical protein